MRGTSTSYKHPAKSYEREEATDRIIETLGATDRSIEGRADVTTSGGLDCRRTTPGPKAERQAEGSPATPDRE
jgi:hypothetical protein